MCCATEKRDGILGDTTLSLHILQPTLTGGMFWKVKTKSAKICLIFNVFGPGGGGSGTKFQFRVNWVIWSKISRSLACLCITDSLSHTTYVETNQTSGADRAVDYTWGRCNHAAMSSSNPVWISFPPTVDIMCIWQSLNQLWFRLKWRPSLELKSDGHPPSLLKIDLCQFVCHPFAQLSLTSFAMLVGHTTFLSCI